MDENEEPPKPEQRKPIERQAAERVAAMLRRRKKVEEEAGSATPEPGPEPDPAVSPYPEFTKDDSEELTAEEAEINQAAERLKKQRERDREVAKYTAGSLDRASTSLATLGVIGPGVGLLYHTTVLATLSDDQLRVAVMSCLGLSLVLHWSGKAILNWEFLR